MEVGGLKSEVGYMKSETENKLPGATLSKMSFQALLLPL